MYLLGALDQAHKDGNPGKPLEEEKEETCNPEFFKPISEGSLVHCQGLLFAAATFELLQG